MRKLYHRLLAFAAATPLAMTGVASASVDGVAPSVERAWAQTVEQGTLEAYASFAMDYPDSDFALEAHKRLQSVSVMPVRTDAVSDDADDDRAEGTSSGPGFIPDNLMIV